MQQAVTRAHGTGHKDVGAACRFGRHSGPVWARAVP
jgi:hypothetical protein